MPSKLLYIWSTEFQHLSLILKHPLKTFFIPLKITQNFNFFCLCYPWLRPYTTHKIEPRSWLCFVLGYSNQHLAYKCYDTSTNKMFISSRVVFIEDQFPLKTTTKSSQPNLQTCTSASPSLSHLITEILVPKSSQNQPPNVVYETTGRLDQHDL